MQHPDDRDDRRADNWESFVFAIQFAAVCYILYTIWN